MSPTGSDRRQAGFTLLELLVVLLIVTVLVGLSVPQFGRTYRHLELQVFASEVANRLTYAGRRAVARGEVLRVQFDVPGRRYWLTRARPASAAATFERVPDKFGRAVAVPGSISLVSRTPAVTFYPDGRADRFEMMISDAGGTAYRLVTDVRTGRVKLLEGDARARR
jgi:type II secretion system protein H